MFLKAHGRMALHLQRRSTRLFATQFSGYRRTEPAEAPYASAVVSIVN